MGAARSLRGQALPLVFAGEGRALSALALGQPVRVWAHSSTRVAGAYVGGIRYSEADGITGALVLPRDPEALAARLAEMLRDPARLKELGRNGIRRVHGQFTWQKVARSVSLLYEQVAGESLAGGRRARMPVAA